MKSILHQSHTHPPLPTLSNFSHNSHHRFSTHAPSPPPETVRMRMKMRTRTRTKAMPMSMINSSHLVVLAVNSPAAADLSVLILTSAAFLFLYWIANFVVPEIIMKDLQSDDASKDQKPNEEGSMPLGETISSESKKKGFQGTK